MLKRRASMIDMVPGVGVGPGSPSARRRPTAPSTVASTGGPPETASPRLASSQVAFQLSDGTRAELQLVQDHYDNHVMVQELTGVLATPGPHGPVGALSLDGVDAEVLSLTIHKCERTGVTTAEARDLLRAAKIVRDVRAALLEDDWAAVDGVIGTVSGADDGGEGAGSAPVASRVAFARSVHSAAQAELRRVKEEVDYRTVLAELTSALSYGGVQGEVGSLNLSTVAVDGLAAALAMAEALGCPTPQSKHLHALVKLVHQVRHALLARDWEAVETLLEASGELLGLSAPLPPSFIVPKPCALEFGMLAAEINNRRVQQRLRAALATGVPVGEVGHLNLGTVSTAELEDALQYGLSVGAATSAAKALMATASLIRALRRSLVRGNWDLLGALIDHATGTGDFTSGVSRSLTEAPSPLSLACSV